MSRAQTNPREQWLRAERGYQPVRKRGDPLRVALIYPNTYHVGMSSLGFQLTYRMVNEHPHAVAERFFIDSTPAGSIETGTPLNQFDLLAFSAAFELDEPHALDLIDRAGLALEARERNQGRREPLVMMGGVLVQVNRLPIYPFFDGFFHGDAEVILPPVLDALAGVDRSQSDLHRRRIEAVAPLPGVEITAGARWAAGMETPRSWEPAARVPEHAEEDIHLPSPESPARMTLHDLDSCEGVTQILTPHTEFSEMALVDLGRGCPHHCTFCWIGHNTPPPRSRSMGAITRAIEGWSGMTDRFGLVSSAVGAHPEIDDLCRWMMKRNLRVSYSSLRVEEVTPVMLEALARGGQKTITIAPEAGNPRVRRLLGKTISDEQILDVIERAMSLGIENIKLYYMIGIPSETDEEGLDIAGFSERIRERMLKWGRKRGRMGYLGLNLGVFVPKPNLPLNHIEPVPPREVKKRLKLVVRRLGRIPNTRLGVSSPDLALAQATLSIGGIEASRYLRLVRGLGGDWRQANRRWRAESQRQFEKRKSHSRLQGEKVRNQTMTSASS